MILYFLKAFLAHFRRARSLFFLTAFGVALGVASVLAIQIINLNAIGAFSAGIQAISGEADLSVVGQTSTFSEELYPVVLGTRGVAAAWPIYRVDVALADHDRFLLEVIGVDLFSPVHLPWNSSPGDLSEALFEKGWIAVTPPLAEQMDWSVGDPIEVTSGTRRAELKIGALVDFKKISPLSSRKLAIMDISQAQGLLGNSGRIHQIDIRLQPGFDRQEVMRELQERLGPSTQVLTPQQREDQAADLMSAFRLNLTALSLISLFVGLFLVYTSTQASLLRRRSEFGLLRSIGATRLQVLALILGEVMILGLVGVGMGLPLGYWVAEANIEVVSSTLTNVYLLQEIESLELSFWLYVLAAGIGIGGAIAGAFFPALDMSRKQTQSLLAAFTLHERVSSLALPLFAAGGSVLLLTLLWFWLLGTAWKPAGFVLAVAVLVSLPLLAPFVIQQVCRQGRIRAFGLSYSLKSLGARLQRCSFAVASLAIAVAMLIGITLMISSFRSTVEIWVESSVAADVYVTTESWRAESEAILDSETASLLASTPGVVGVDRLRKIRVSLEDRRISLSGVNMSLFRGSAFPLLEGNREEVFARVIEQNAVLISEPLSRKAALSVGDQLVVYGPDGRVEFPIAGVYYDYSSEAGTAAMDLSTMENGFGPGGINGISLYLDKSRDPERVVDELKARFIGQPLRIRSNRHLREDILKVFDQTFAVVRILQIMSLLIAVSGITLTLLVLAREQVAELALYRALGAGRRQIFRIFVGQGLAMGVMGLALGLAGGIILALILVFVINRSYFGWTIQLHWPGLPLVQQMMTILAAALLASLYPALRASRTQATELSHDDL